MLLVDKGKACCLSVATGPPERFQAFLDFCAPRRVYFSSMENRTADAVEARPARGRELKDHIAMIPTNREGKTLLELTRGYRDWEARVTNKRAKYPTTAL